MASMYPDLNEGENTQVKSNETVAYSGPDKGNDVEEKKTKKEDANIVVTLSPMSGLHSSDSLLLLLEVL